AVFSANPKRGDKKESQIAWRSCGLRKPDEHGLDTRLMLIDKRRCWRALNVCLWFNENSDFYNPLLGGESEIFALAFRKVKKAYTFAPPISSSDREPSRLAAGLFTKKAGRSFTAIV